MIESIKTLLWNRLKEKKVSLAMIFDTHGDILWHRGRDIKGKSIHSGSGFSRTLINRALHMASIENTGKKDVAVNEEDVLISLSESDLPGSALTLNVKSLIIIPIWEGFYLYIDSGVTEAFSAGDYDTFKLLGSLLGESIRKIRKSELVDIGGISGSSTSMDRVKELVLKYSLEEEPVFILGETGVGKSHMAGLIHRYSGRPGRFVVIDTVAVNENLLESEIFGHKKGSFTGAISDKKGLIDEAHMGTLFFDEIAEVPATFQAKLLRFIETRQYRAVGDTKEKIADVRILAATNKDMNLAINEKEFRQDLYFRLSVLKVHIPPLRERIEDIRAMVQEKRQWLKGKEIGPDFWDILIKYHWPGNLRQLISVLKRAGILCDPPIGGDQLQTVIDEDVRMSTPEAMKSREAENDEIQSIWTALREGKTFWDVVKEPFLDRELNRREVKTIVSMALNEVGGRYIDALPIFNIPAGDYKRLMKFLHKNRLQP